VRQREKERGGGEMEEGEKEMKRKESEE